MRGRWPRQLVELREVPGKNEHRLVHSLRQRTDKIDLEIPRTLLANSAPGSLRAVAFGSNFCVPLFCRARLLLGLLAKP